MEEKRTNPAELTVEEINVYTVDCGNTRYRCMHDCIMTRDIYDYGRNYMGSRG